MFSEIDLSVKIDALYSIVTYCNFVSEFCLRNLWMSGLVGASVKKLITFPARQFDNAGVHTGIATAELHLVILQRFA